MVVLLAAGLGVLTLTLVVVALLATPDHPHIATRSSVKGHRSANRAKV
jgi:hypothetical protein